MNVNLLVLSLVASVCAGAVQAEFAKVNDVNQFKSIVSGKTLTRPLIRLEVTPAGVIRGTGVRWDVTGNWSWRDGYFCRDLYWGGDDLGYNCQEVAVKDGRIRFTSDRGRGASAVFALRSR